MAKEMLEKKYWHERQESREGWLLGTDLYNRTTGLLVFPEEGIMLEA